MLISLTEAGPVIYITFTATCPRRLKPASRQIVGLACPGFWPKHLAALLEVDQSLITIRKLPLKTSTVEPCRKPTSSFAPTAAEASVGTGCRICLRTSRIFQNTNNVAEPQPSHFPPSLIIDTIALLLCKIIQRPLNGFPVLASPAFVLCSTDSARTPNNQKSSKTSNMRQASCRTSARRLVAAVR
jgi:hypothetical protein